MTQDDVIRLAREIASSLASRMCDENGETHGEELYCMAFDEIVDAVKLVADKEREALLDLVDAYAKNNTDLADAIRATGQE